MTSTSRIPKTEITGLYGGLVKMFGRKMFGKVPESAAVMWHNPAVFKTLSGVGQKAEKKWNACDDELKAFAHMAVSSLVGCSFCLDFGYFMAHHKGLDEAKASEVPRWRESDAFTTRERDVMEYAEAMSQTPPTVTDERIGKTHLTYGMGASAEAVAALTILIADRFGLPVSTTHILSSGVAGASVANGAGLQRRTVLNMALAWILTLPVAMLLSGGLYWLLLAGVRATGM